MPALLPPVPGVAFTCRLGGVSPPPWDSLNLGTSTGDDPSRVAANREQVSAALGISPGWSRVHQVHGRAVSVVGPVQPAPGTPGDALVVTEPGRPAAVLFADCVPVALTSNGAVGAVHAGWRGLCAGVLEAAVAAARPLGGPLTGWIGPCIGPCCYEVGPEVPAAFEEGHPGFPPFDRSVGGRRTFDLAAAAVAVLAAQGVAVGGVAGLCTSCDPRFYSHRRDGKDGPTGRQALLVWRAFA